MTGLGRKRWVRRSAGLDQWMLASLSACLREHFVQSVLGHLERAEVLYPGRLRAIGSSSSTDFILTRRSSETVRYRLLARRDMRSARWVANGIERKPRGGHLLQKTALLIQRRHRGRSLPLKLPNESPTKCEIAHTCLSRNLQK